MTRLFFLVVLLTLAFASGSEVHKRQLSGHLLLTGDPLSEAEQLFLQGNFDEAELLARFSAATAFNDAERKRAQALSTRIADSSTFTRHARNFIHGAVSGEPKDLAGFLGSLSLDLFVVGDVRDIAVQGYREIRDGDGDKLILALSTVGLVTTLSPQFDFAPALLKVFRRTGALGERFVKSISRTSRTALATGDYSRMGKIVTDFGGAAKALGPAPMARVMKHVDNPAQLARVSKLAKADAPVVYGLTTMTNGKAIKTFARTADVGTLAKAARRGSRAGKIFAKAVVAIPDWLLIGLFLTASFAAATTLATLIPRRRTARRRAIDRGIPVLTQRVVA
jgi:hypothetical protein